MSLINVMLALFSDDPHPITNPIIKCTKMSHFSMNEKQNNQASIILQDMWLNMLCWGQILATKLNMQDLSRAVYICIISAATEHCEP